MKKQLRAVAAMFGALAVVVLGASAAQATYPEPTFNLSVSPHVVVGGNTIDATVTASVTCTQWRVTFLGQTATGTDTKTFTHTFTTQVVSERELRPIHAVCTYDTGAGAAGNAVRVIDAKSPVLKDTIAILPRKSSTNTSASGLPGTGGPALWIPIAAAVLILGGAYTVLRNRRHNGGDGGHPSAPAA